MVESTSIGVTGPNGRLGSEFVRRGCVPIDCDLTEPKSIESAIQDKNLKIIINCAAYTNVDGSEAGRLNAYAVNAFGPQNLAKVFPGKIVHLSTDYIFDGVCGPYTEEDISSPICAYGFTKHFGDVGLGSFMERVLIVRTTILYDTGPKPNFVLAIYNQLKANNIVRSPKTLVGNPTYVPHLADGIKYAIDNDITGILNIAGKTLVSRFTLSHEIARWFKFNPSNIVNSPAWGEAHRPEKCGLVLDKAKDLGLPLYSLWEGLDAFQRKLEQEELVYAVS